MGKNKPPELVIYILPLLDFIKQQRIDLAEFDETLVKCWLKQITVWENHFTVELKSGLKIDIEG
ncbi:integrase [uncultured Sharpea sp.]|uniref:integrase n=1 Tax=uncultured Sharpea sp. TaxID=1112738 RepID=UPI00258988BC|nr:integrase [uncultured Sharpea sp.]